MKFGLKSGINFFIYSSLNIALAATAFTLEGFVILDQSINYNYLAMVFCATLLTYSIHRLVGIEKVSDTFNEGRFKIIKDFKIHIIVYSIVSLFGTIYFISQLDRQLILLLGIPAFISGLYILPIFTNQKRLRDYDYIKIILISLTWAVVGLLPFVNISSPKSSILLLIFIEKFIYIFAITLPFDLRDLAVDSHTNVKTFPKIWGFNKTYKVINFSLLIAFAAYTILVCFGINNLVQLLPIAVAYIISYGAVKLSKGKLSDYYYSGLLDGVITIRSIIIILGFVLLTQN